jgi:hypothetical protein
MILKEFQIKEKNHVMMLAKKEDREDTSNEGKESLKTLDCNDSKCDDVEFFSSEEDDLETVCVKFDDNYAMERIEENLL